MTETSDHLSIQQYAAQVIGFDILDLGMTDMVSAGLTTLRTVRSAVRSADFSPQHFTVRSADFSPQHFTVRSADFSPQHFTD